MKRNAPKVTNAMAEVTITDNQPIVSKNGESLEVDLSGIDYQWLDCNASNAAIPAAKSQTFRPTNYGDFAVAVTENECMDTSECINYPRTASLQEVGATQVQLVPNPANHYFELTNTSKSDIYSLINQQGQIVQTGNASSDKIPAAHLRSGIYYVAIHSQSGIKTLRLVIIH